MRRSPALALLLAALAAPAAAQFPGSLAGVVTDASTGAPVPAVLVEVPAAGRAVRTDAAGAFFLRGLEAGSHRVSARRTGYAAREAEAVVRDGATTRVALALHPLPVVLPEVAGGAGARSPGSARVERAEIQASGARDLAEVLERSGAVTVTGTGATGERRASIRGGSADAVLVLVDGVALNDPVTGEADLTRLPAQSIERVTVLSGAQSARYGPRAEAGVVLVETRTPRAVRLAALSLGTLGERAASAEWGAGGAGAGIAVGAHARSVEGRFRFREPFTDQIATRRNGDLSEGGAWAVAAAPLGGGELRARLGWDALERGIPGRSYRLSPHARQDGDRGRASLAWRRARGTTALALTASGELRGMHYANPAPPDSFPYDSRVRARTLALRGELVGGEGRGLLRGWGVGADATAQHVRAGSLSDAAPRSRVDAGAWASASAGTPELGLSADLRVDRDGVDGVPRPTHTVALSAAAGPLTGRLAHRSAFSPPTLGDQFFQEGVGVAPNPDLAPERVPSEWELSAAWADRLGGVRAEAGGAAFRADVRGMILWSPDFRGIWSPRNADVDRSGVELWARAGADAVPLTVSADWSLARVTYDWEGDFAPVQVVYRPRSAGAVRLGWAPAPWRAEVAARYTGWRNPTPENANRLPGFWTLSARVARRWRVAGSMLDAAVDVDRLGGERDALIFGHPEPGRRVRIDLRLRGAGSP